MSDVVQVSNQSTPSNPAEPGKKKGMVTGTKDRSEVESMIQRYLELAASALKDKPVDRGK